MNKAHQAINLLPASTANFFEKAADTLLPNAEKGQTNYLAVQQYFFHEVHHLTYKKRRLPKILKRVGL